MAAVDDGVGRELGDNIVKAVHEVVVIAAVEVGAADAHLEEGVAGEGHMLFGTVEDDAAGGVAWGLEDTELVVAEADDLAGEEITAYSRELTLELDADDGLELARQVGDEEIVLGGNLYLQAVVVVDGVDAVVVVEVTVGGQQVDGLQAVVADIVEDGGALLFIIGAAVDDDAFFGLVAHHVGVFGEQVANEGLDVEHKKTKGVDRLHVSL